jgi:xanthine/CO dehydrogenase XdhC/CoxF family maturation factor
MRELLQQIVESLAAGRPVACCRLVETRGSTPQKPGAMMLVFADGSQLGTLGGGCVEAEVKRQALAALRDSTATIASFTLDDDYGWDDGLICGGAMRVLLDLTFGWSMTARSLLPRNGFHRPSGGFVAPSARHLPTWRSPPRRTA